MNSITVNNQNQFLNNKIKSLCIVCNKNLNKCKSKSVQDILPDVDPPTTVFEALKLLSNFQQLTIDDEQLQICDKCFQNTSSARLFQLLCNKSVENIKAYIDKREENEYNEEFNFINSEVKSEEICVTYGCDGGDDDKNEGTASEEEEIGDFHSDSDDFSIPEKKCKKVKHKKANKTKDDDNTSSVPRKECPHCHEMFNRDYLYRHIRIHTGISPYTCKMCDKSFKIKSALTDHMLYHNNERNFLCSFCGASFHVKPALEKHIRMHTDERPYVCETCGKTFRTMTGRKIHYTVHTGEKNYSCEKCIKTFSTARSLRQHKVVHAEVKPFECMFCGKRFTHKHVLKSHQAKTCRKLNLK